MQLNGDCRLYLWSLSLIVLAVGCNKQQQPPTGLQIVEGSVIGSDGKAYSRGGLIEFRMVTDRKIRATSALDSAGRFRLQFADANARFQGALPGTYDVTIYPSGSQVVEPLKVAEPIVIKAEETALQISLATPSP